MPQMSPMWWTLMMLLFIFSMFLLMSLMYFNFLNKSMLKNKKNIHEMNWKW
uniref:ATP synthase F0 subunit 8 n=1 Tax=Erragonalia choui TaxID=700820 RepID=UPI0022FDAB37|nr:ATP synthase F0 subunit 8 [Erragonalia choui]WAP91661.1 ATP synthase F0 subunit 8 [Erragonalia choui]